MDVTALVAIVGFCCTVLGVIISYTVMRHNMNKDTKIEGRETGTFLTEIGYIKANTDEIKTEQREQRKTNTEFVARLTAVETSAKQAHKRIDLLEGRKPRED